MTSLRTLLAPALLLTLAPAVATPAEVACSDALPAPAACPDLAPDARYMSSWSLSRETFPRTEGDCAIEEGLVEPGTRTLVRFTTGAQNRGPGDLVLGNPDALPQWFSWSPCHGHHHFGDFAHYRVWDPAAYARWSALRAAAPDAPASELLRAHPDLATGLRAGHKQGYCIVDGHPMHPFAGYPAFPTCQNQGISAGWEDVYGGILDGQWVDVTGLAPGSYVLEVELNPERRIGEASYGENAASTLIALD